MLAVIKLLLPALTPSWRFFDSIGPSPRIEYVPPNAIDWRAFRPRPAIVAWRQMWRRLFWNPDCNESLFLTSCAERLLESPNSQSIREIEARLADAPWRQWRIVLTTRDETRLVREIAYLSPARLRA